MRRIPSDVARQHRGGVDVKRIGQAAIVSQGCHLLVGGMLGIATTGNAAAADARSADEDFRKRCAHPAVIRCTGFDDPASIKGRVGQPAGITRGAAEPALDTTQKASGTSSLRFTVPSNSPADTSGSYFANFSDDLTVQFGENQEFFIQWRQRFTSEIIRRQYRGGGGIKLIIVGTGDQPRKAYYSCSALEVVVTTYNQQGFPIMYNSCTGSSSHGAYAPFHEPVIPPGGSEPNDYKLQNARAAPFCLWQKKTFFPPKGNCFGYVADEWMTFQLRIKTGPRVKDEFTNSQVTLWMARENRPSEPVINWGPYNLTAGPPGEDQRFGKVWLTPYNTGKDPSEAHPVAYTWYDELIISRAKIPDPAVQPKPQP